MNANLNPKVSSCASWKQGICGLLMGVGLSAPAYAANDAAVSVAGWSVALVIVLGIAYLFSKRKE